MKIDQLLQQRSALLRQTRLANVAFVFAELSRFADRIERGNLRGPVTLHLPDALAERVWPSLVAEDGRQAVIDEHFIDQDIMDLADLLLFAAAIEPAGSLTFRLEEFRQRFLPSLRDELAAAGVQLRPETTLSDPGRTG